MLPLMVAAKKVRKVNPTSSIDMLAPFLLTMIVSFVVLIGSLFACKFMAPDVVAGYGFGELAAFVVGVIVFGISVSKRR